MHDHGHRGLAADPGPLLRQRSERPCDTRAKKRDELAPPHRFPSAEMYCRRWYLAAY
jgi:hypothetical protein